MIRLSAFRDGKPAGQAEAREGQNLRIGRASTNDLVLDSPAVSREHCRVAHDGTAWRVMDLGARAGVFVNGEVVTEPRALADGDTLEVPDFKLEAHITPPQKAAPAAEHTAFQPRPAIRGEGPNAVEIAEGPGQGTIQRFAGRLRVGRSSQCDLVLDDPAVSREHLLIEAREGRFLAINQNPKNAVLRNGAPITQAPVVTGDLLTLGQTTLRLALSQAPKRAVGPSPLTRLLGNKKLVIAGGIGLFVLLLALFFLSRPAKTPRDAVQEQEWAKDQTRRDANFMRQVSTLLIQARRLLDDGQDEQAKARLTALLEIDADNTEAKELLASLQDKAAARAAAAKEREAQAAKLREIALPQVRQAEAKLAGGDLDGAKAALGQALAVAADLPEVKQVQAKIEAQEAAQQRQATQRAQAAESQRSQLVGLYRDGETALRADKLYDALVVYRRLAEAEIDPKRTEAARRKVAEIQDALVKRIMPDYTLGQKLYGQKKYGEAYKVWCKVLAVYPEAKETRAKVDELTPQLEAEAKRLYEEGLVYQGLGDRETARVRWREVMETLPLADNVYYRRAAAKLGLAASDKGKKP